ncbi:MAG: hypothetical protein ACWGQW_06300 [bacterium]
MDNYEVQPAVDYGEGEVHDYILKDAVTQAEWELNEFGAKTAMRNLPALQEMIDNNTWRSVRAADVRLKIIRLATQEDIEVPEHLTV